MSEGVFDVASVDLSHSTERIPDVLFDFQDWSPTVCVACGCDVPEGAVYCSFLCVSLPKGDWLYTN